MDEFKANGSNIWEKQKNKVKKENENIVSIDKKDVQFIRDNSVMLIWITQQRSMIQLFSFYIYKIYLFFHICPHLCFWSIQNQLKSIMLYQHGAVNLSKFLYMYISDMFAIGFNSNQIQISGNVTCFEN